MAPLDSEGLLPVTVLSGFLGAGKTTLLKRLLRSLGEEDGGEGGGAGGRPGRLRVAVLVNDMGEINLDAAEIKSAKLIREEAQMVELHNGCICCTLRGDLLKTVKALSEEKSFDYLVIESTGISEPLPVAQTFVMDVDAAVQQHGHEHGPPSPVRALSKFARLDTMVTVVDALNIFDVLGSIENLAEKNMTGMVGNTGIREDDADSDEEDVDERNITQLMLDQIEFANVIIVSKAPLFKQPELLPKVTGLLRRLNPGARVLVPKEMHFADLPLSEVINTKLFDMEKAQSSAGWIAELRRSATGEGHTPETEEYGVSSVLFKCHSRPFHAQRFRDVLRGFGNYAKVAGVTPSDDGDDDGDDDDPAVADGVKVHAGTGPFEGVVRAKGRLWIATACSYPINMQISGRHLDLVPAQPFLHAVMSHLWPNDHWEELEHFSDIKARDVWFEDSGYGDSMSEAVFIGIHLDRERIMKALEDALLTDEELAGGKAAWKEHEDVFFGGRFFDVRPDEPGVLALKQVVRRK